MYRRGASKERALMHLLEDKGFVVLRSAGSKGIDLIAGKKGRIFLIEVKYTSRDFIYLSIDSIASEVSKAQNFGGKFLLAIKFSRKPWVFVDAERFLDMASQRVKKNLKTIKLGREDLKSLPSIELLIDKNLNEYL